MRVMLIQLRTILNEPPIFPLGLCYLATALTQHEVRILDLNVVKKPWLELRKAVESFQPEVIGLSLRNIKVFKPGVHLSSLTSQAEMIHSVKRLSPDVPLVVGGAAFSLYAEEIMGRIKEIDFGIFSEGEQSLLELLHNLDHPERVKGVFYRLNSQVQFTGFREWLSLQDSPIPRRDWVDMAPYLNDPVSMGIQTKRGCMLQCIHCCDRFLLGKSVRLRSPTKVVDEVEEVVKKNGVSHLFFADQVFNIPMEHAEAICREMIRRKIRVNWMAWFNEKYFVNEFARLVKEAGCSMANFSPDGASNLIFRRFRKNLREENLSNTCWIAKKHSLPVTYNFMVNGPGENWYTLLKLASFLLRAKIILGRLLRLHGLFIVPLRIYPHSELEEIARQQGIITGKTDLMKPVFYNPHPLRYPVKMLDLVLSLIWRLKHAFTRRHPQA